MSSVSDVRHMARALQLAERGLYSAHPNPRVGCVIARGEEVLGEGFHARAGEPHAEVEALRDAGEAAHGATAYVTLEPCCHTGRTPPCTGALIDAGVTRVVAAMRDPDPRVAGQGLAALEAAGIETASGVLEGPARALNAGFISRNERGRPYVRIKTGMSLDGRTAMASGESRWITGSESRRDVQHLRARSSAILTGSGTVRSDDPALTVRTGDWIVPPGCTPPPGQPLRVVLDSRCSLPADARVFTGPGASLRACAGPAPAGIAALSFPGTGGRVDLAALLAHLAGLECNEVLVEAGATLAGAFVQAGLADELLFYVAPDLLGGEARPALELPGLDKLEERVRLEWTDIRRVGRDLRITAVPRRAGG